MEPHSYLYRYSDPTSGKPVWRDSNGEWNGQKPTAFQGLYTADQLEATQAPLIAAMREGVEALDLAIGLHQYLGQRFGPNSPEGREVECRSERTVTALTNMRDTLAKIEGEEG